MLVPLDGGAIWGARAYWVLVLDRSAGAETGDTPPDERMAAREQICGTDEALDRPERDGPHEQQDCQRWDRPVVRMLCNRCYGGRRRRAVSGRVKKQNLGVQLPTWIPSVRNLESSAHKPERHSIDARSTRPVRLHSVLCILHASSGQQPPSTRIAGELGSCETSISFGAWPGDESCSEPVVR